jgi:hypothetical protein
VPSDAAPLDLDAFSSKVAALHDVAERFLGVVENALPTAGTYSSSVVCRGPAVALLSADFDGL